MHSLPYVALRFGNVYGPRQNPHGEAGVVAIFTTMLHEGKQPTINGPGTQTRDYVYVGDVVRAVLAALKHLEDGGDSDVFNVGTGIETDVNELFGHLSRLTGADAPEQHGPAKAGEQQRSVLDVHKAGLALDWQPKVPLSQGLEETVAWFKDKE